jgi:type IV secretory pathway VirB2 component (pilin)
MISSIFFHPTIIAQTACEKLTGTGCSTGLQNNTPTTTTIQSVLGFVLAIIAAVAVLMIVIAGLRFITGSGSPQETAKARSTIIYALVGLILALAAQSIVRLVINHI